MGITIPNMLALFPGAPKNIGEEHLVSTVCAFMAFQVFWGTWKLL